MVGEFVEYLVRTNLAGFDPHDHINCVWMRAFAVPALGSQKEEDQKFKIILGYKTSLRPV